MLPSIWKSHCRLIGMLHTKLSPMMLERVHYQDFVCNTYVDPKTLSWVRGVAGVVGRVNLEPGFSVWLAWWKGWEEMAVGGILCKV
jgi:hypothetical protein